jgi:murein DD-endopeptidase MepM/ murein hydrolase activator NlpD
MPVKAGVTTSEFGDKDSRNTAHQGHDWAVSSGTEVVAVADGIVEKAYYSESYGYNVLISHGEGTETRYAHLSALSVSTGEKVKQNQTIGLSGSTGDSTGPHLHFEVVNNGTRVNPMPYFK